MVLNNSLQSPAVNNYHMTYRHAWATINLTEYIES